MTHVYVYVYNGGMNKEAYFKGFIETNEGVTETTGWQGIRDGGPHGKIPCFCPVYYGRACQGNDDAPMWRGCRPVKAQFIPHE